MPTMTWRTVTPEQPHLGRARDAIAYRGAHRDVPHALRQRAAAFTPRIRWRGSDPRRRHAAVSPPRRRYAGLRQQPLRADARLRDLRFDDRGGPRSRNRNPSARGDDQRGSLCASGRDRASLLAAGTGTEPCIRSGHGAIGGSTAISISSGRRLWPSTSSRRERSRAAPT